MKIIYDLYVTLTSMINWWSVNVFKIFYLFSWLWLIISLLSWSSKVLNFVEVQVIDSFFVSMLKISYMYIICFYKIHSPFPPFQFLPYSLQLHALSLFENLLRLINAYICKGLEPFTRAWVAFQGQHLRRKLTQPPSAAINCQ